MKTLAERFWEKVDKSGDCWLWTAAATGDGYGAFRVDGKMQGAHRASWELTNGPIPKGLCACHRCDVPLCCNPEHLFLGSQAENMADRNAKGRQAHGEANGNSKLTEAQVVEIRAATGTQKEIALRFGISQMHVSDIRTGKRRSRLVTL